MNRRQRRRDLAKFKRDAPGALLTFLVPPTDPALNSAPLLKAAASDWMSALSTRVRHCIVCSSWIADRQSVGGLLLAAPATVRPTSASVCAICRACWEADLPLDALER